MMQRYLIFTLSFDLEMAEVELQFCKAFAKMNDFVYPSSGSRDGGFKSRKVKVSG